MGRKHKPGNFWQSAALNSAFYTFWFNKLQTIAVNRFKWLNLPNTCDERYLETTLLREGVATIACPKKQPGVLYSTQAMLNGPLNVYDNPGSWRSFGNNGWSFDVDPRNGVLIYDNRLRASVLDKLDAYARLLAQFDITLLGNLNAQKTSWLIKGDQTQENTMRQLFKQVEGGEPAIIASKGIEAIDISAISLQVPFIGEQINAAKSQVWADALAFLGVDSLPRKSERMIEEEVTAVNEPTSLMAMDGLNCRREAAEKLNRRFGTNIQVVWAQDNFSDAYNAAVNPLIDKEVI